MRVLQLGKYYPPYKGGIENHLHVLCNELRRDVDVDVVVCNSERATRHERVNEIPVTRCYELARVASTSICPTMPLELARRRYDIVHLHCPHPMGVMSYLLAGRGHEHGVVISYHSDVVRQQRLLRAYKPFMDWALDRADAVICASPDYIGGSDSLMRVRDKCRVVPYGIDRAQFELTPAVRAEVAAIKERFRDRPLVVAVGRFVYYKGFEYAIEAMRHVDAELALVGDGPLRGALEEQARAAGVADRVHFVGAVSNEALVAWYHACDVYTLPSTARSEAFAIVQLEAMACGKPVVNTAIRHSGVPFASRDGESGLTVPPKDAVALARAIASLLADPERRRRLGEAGRARVDREFTKEAMAAGILDVYREVAEARAARRRVRPVPLGDTALSVPPS